MRRVSYLRLAACLPILPLAAVPLIDRIIHPSGVLGLLAFAALVGGIPYLACAAISLYLLRRKPPQSYWRLARWAPVIFAAVFGAFAVALGLVIDPSASLSDAWVYPVAVGLYSLYALPIGYFYVLLAWLGYVALERLGVLGDAA